MGDKKISRRFRAQILFLQLGIVLFTLIAVAVIVMRVEVDRVEDAAFERVGTVARETAQLAAIQQAMDNPDPEANPSAVVAPLAHLAESVSDVDYVTVADLNGIRLAHPDPTQIGKQVSSDHAMVREGQSFRGVEEGTVGVTLRVKEPIYVDGEVVGTVSVGILQSKVRASLVEIVWAFAPWIILAVALGTVAAAFAARSVRRIYGVSPEHIGSLMQAQEAVLYSVSDGVLGVDEDGRLSLINEEAKRLLNLPQAAVGQQAEQVLDQDLVHLLRSESPDAESAHNVLSGERLLIATRREAVLSGKHHGHTLTLRDQTELENTLRELRGQRSMTDTLRAQAHEFTNRLHLISGLLSLGEYSEAQDHLRTFSGATTKNTDRQLQDPTLAALINAKQAVAREAGVTLKLHPSTLIMEGFRSTEDEFTVAANLISNAIDASGDHGQVEVRINIGSTGVRIEVNDSGPGIRPEDSDRVVTLGYSNKVGASAGGRGIGLTLVDRITRRRGGVLKFGLGPLGGARVIAAWPPSPQPHINQIHPAKDTP